VESDVRRKASRRRLGVGLAVSLAPVALFAAACGSTDPSQAATAQTPGLQAYVDCLGRNGVVLPGGAGGGRSPGAGPRPSFSGFPSGRPSAFPSGRPSGGAGGGGFGGGGGFLGTQAPAGVDPNTWAKAMQACGGVRPSAGAARDSSAQRAYRNCLSEHGVSATANLGQLNTADPAIASALQTCAPLRPTAPAPSPSG
jgi:hypothetical protein